MAAWSPFITGKRIAPNPNAETFQASLPNLRYFISPSYLFVARSLFKKQD
jgi:hypothetical protein